MDVTPSRYGASVVHFMVVGLASGHIPEKAGVRWTGV